MPPQHTCPQTVTEGDDVNCVCFSDDLGLPSGYVMWTRTNSSKLKIEKVNRTFDWESNVCVLMWNNTAVQSVTYNITMNCKFLLKNIIYLFPLHNLLKISVSFILYLSASLIPDIVYVFLVICDSYFVQM